MPRELPLPDYLPDRGGLMLSPHAVARVRSLFTMAVDADRTRRAAGLPEPEREVGTARPMAGYRLTDLMQAQARIVVQTSVFSGG